MRACALFITTIRFVVKRVFLCFLSPRMPGGGGGGVATSSVMPILFSVPLEIVMIFSFASSCRVWMIAPSDCPSSHGLHDVPADAVSAALLLVGIHDFAGWLELASHGSVARRGSGLLEVDVLVLVMAGLVIGRRA